MYPSNRDEGIGGYGPVYTAIERALWALGPALILLFAFNFPSMQAARQQAEAQVDVAIAAENTEYCLKWGMAVESAEHGACIRDLVAIRAQGEQRVRDTAASDF